MKTKKLAKCKICAPNEPIAEWNWEMILLSNGEWLRVWECASCSSQKKLPKNAGKIRGRK